MEIESPRVANWLNDKGAGVKYEVLAYRALTRAELLGAVAAYLRQFNGRKPKRGTVVTVLTIIGMEGR